jgi:elongation factor P--beta-lysine ligase
MEKIIERYIAPELRTILLQYPTVRVSLPRTTAQQKKIEERLKELDRLVAAVRK